MREDGAHEDGEMVGAGGKGRKNDSSKWIFPLFFFTMRQ